MAFRSTMDYRSLSRDAFSWGIFVDFVDNQVLSVE